MSIDPSTDLPSGTARRRPPPPAGGRPGDRGRRHPGDRLRAAGLDLLIVHLATYCTSSQILPAVQRAGVPVLVIDLQPDDPVIGVEAHLHGNATFEFADNVMVKVASSGYLNASGSDFKHITFTAHQKSQDTFWKGIFFASASTSKPCCPYSAEVITAASLVGEDIFSSLTSDGQTAASARRFTADSAWACGCR